jgi:hypothetical protein
MRIGRNRTRLFPTEFIVSLSAFCRSHCYGAAADMFTGCKQRVGAHNTMNDTMDHTFVQSHNPLCLYFDR